MDTVRQIIALAFGAIIIAGCGDASDEPVIDVKVEMLGACPSYHLLFFNSGIVKYEGLEGTQNKGALEYKLSKETMDALIREFDRARFLELDDRKDQSSSETKMQVECEYVSKFMIRNKELINACIGKKTIELKHHQIVESGNISVMYRARNRSKTIYINDVNSSTKVMAFRLLQMATEAAAVDKWVGKSECVS